MKTVSVAKCFLNIRPWRLSCYFHNGAISVAQPGGVAAITIRCAECIDYVPEPFQEEKKQKAMTTEVSVGA